ncbi:hypothetical protein JOL79_05400 [Microbispora sp. RL4-1S]|uniref:Condensation domain-containing protein n=1 Tax=Microbispora oryzae TaxID=2806554 RepID=A0A940WD07_9ACTN|nr:condensation domain-containing protein [Microbispora oryzae]MBP2703235.1 hypothetical protein [Microbispora oryzae]
MDPEVLRKLAGLSGAERARLLGRLRRNAGVADAAARLEPRGGGGPAAASFVQEQLWFLHQLAPAQPSYNVSFSFRLSGPLDEARLLSVIDGIVARHDVLRARLVLRDGALTQVPDVELPPVEIVDLPDEAAVRERVLRLAREPFDLGAGPLTRIALLRLSPVEHLLVWVAHHCILDGWSFGLILDELRAGYQGETRPAPELRYADVAAWQRERLAAGEYAAPLARWRTRLEGAPSVTFPTDRPRPAAQTFAGAQVDFTVPDDVAAALTALADRSGVTLFSVLLAAYQALLARWSGAPSVVVGVPLAGRGRPELNGVMGPLANTLPVRADLPLDATFADVLARVHGSVLDALEDQDVPFARMVEQLAEGRDPSRNPLFQVLFNLGNLPQGADGVDLTPDLRLRPDAHPNGTVRMDAELTMESGAGGLGGRLEYATALYDPDTAAGLVDGFQRLLAAVAADPGVRVADLPGPPPREPAPARPVAARRARRSRMWAELL